jgi:hypothetical protein
MYMSMSPSQFLSSCPCLQVNFYLHVYFSMSIMSMSPCPCLYIHVSLSMSPCLCLHVSMYLCLHVQIPMSMSSCPCIHVSMFHCLHVSIYPSFYVSIFPCFNISMFPYLCDSISPVFREGSVFLSEFRVVFSPDFRGIPRNLGDYGKQWNCIRNGDILIWSSWGANDFETLISYNSNCPK